MEGFAHHEGGSSARDVPSIVDLTELPSVGPATTTCTIAMTVMESEDKVDDTTA